MLDSAIADSGALFVAAAGNSGVDMDAAGAVRFYPAASTLSNIVSVGAVDQNGQARLVQRLRQDLGRPRRAGHEHPQHVRPEPGGCASRLLRVPGGDLDGRAARDRDRGPRRQRQRRRCWPTRRALKARLLATGEAAARDRRQDRDRADRRRGPRHRRLAAGRPTTPDRFTVPVGTIIGASTVKTLVSWPAATDIGQRRRPLPAPPSRRLRLDDGRHGIEADDGEEHAALCPRLHVRAPRPRLHAATSARRSRPRRCA